MYLQSFFWQRLGFPQHDVAENMTRDQIYRIRKEGGVEELLEKKKKKKKDVLSICTIPAPPCKNEPKMSLKTG